MRSSERSPFSPTGPAASTNAHTVVPTPRAAEAQGRPRGTRLQPPPSVTRGGCGYEDPPRLLAASSTALPERDDAKDGFASVLVMLALCVFVGLIVSAALATSRGLSAGKDPESRQPETREPAAVLRQQASAVAAQALDGSWNSVTDGGAGETKLRTRASQVDGDDEHHRNGSVHLLGSWEDPLEPREWTMDLTPDVTNESTVQFPMTAGDNATSSSDRLSMPTANKRGATAPFEDTTPKSTTPDYWNHGSRKDSINETKAVNF